MNSLPPVYYTSAKAFVTAVLAGNKVANSQTLLMNEVLLSTQFTPLGSRNTYTGALTLPKNDVAVSLQASIENESGGAITPGDYVDIVASFVPGGSETLPAGFTPPTQTGFVLQNVKVIAVGPFVPGSQTTATNSVAASGSTMLTFQCDRPTALIIQHVKDYPGSWLSSVFLRSAYSSQSYPVRPVTGPQFFNSAKNKNFFYGR
jgi:Flp pilus assembly protein CpaB